MVSMIASISVTKSTALLYPRVITMKKRFHSIRVVRTNFNVHTLSTAFHNTWYAMELLTVWISRMKETAQKYTSHLQLTKLLTVCILTGYAP